MRRWIILFLLFVLPLQLSWAAVGSACLHESGAAAQHFGHHGHVHKNAAKAADEKVGEALSKLGIDADCSLCHAGAVFAVLDVEGWGLASRGATSVHAPAARQPLGIFELPERPNWHHPV